MPVNEPSPKGEQHDFNVKPDRPMLDVVEIMLDPFFQRRITAPTVNLRLASGASATVTLN